MNEAVFSHQLPSSLKMNAKYTVHKKGRTVAVENLSKSAVDLIIDQMMKRSTPMSYRMKVGITTLHPKDRYDRQVGRRLALERMIDVGVSVTKMIVDDKVIKIKMENEELELSLTIKKYKDSGKIRIFIAKPFDFSSHDEIDW